MQNWMNEQHTEVEFKIDSIDKLTKYFFELKDTSNSTLYTSTDEDNQVKKFTGRC